MKVRFKKLKPNAVIPAKAHSSDAGFDLAATSVEDNGDIVVYGTGIAMEIPDGHVGLVFPRSSVSKKGLTLTNGVGVVDSGYRGEILAKFRKAGNDGRYEVGDRIAQLIIIPYPAIEFEESEELTSSDRGQGGFGSSGK